MIRNNFDRFEMNFFSESLKQMQTESIQSQTFQQGYVFYFEKK